MGRTLTANYYRTVARSVRVPEMWVGDAAQDMALAVWLDGNDTPRAIRRNAIDCVRRYGRFSRSGHDRETVTLDKVTRGATDRYETLLTLDIWIAARSLTVKQRAALRRRMAGLPMTSLASAHASAARRKLRAAMAA